MNGPDGDPVLSGDSVDFDFAPGMNHPLPADLLLDFIIEERPFSSSHRNHGVGAARRYGKRSQPGSAKEFEPPALQYIRHGLMGHLQIRHTG